MINNSSNNNKTNNYLSPQTIEHKKDLHIYGMYFHVSDWHTSQTSFNKYTVRRMASLERDNLPVVVFHYLILYEIYIKWMAYNGRVLIRKGLLQYCLKICLVIFSEEIFLIFFLKILEIC
jgi:hypothetical protein